jgi:hypothetical protein
VYDALALVLLVVFLPRCVADHAACHRRHRAAAADRRARGLKVILLPLMSPPMFAIVAVATPLLSVSTLAT